MKRLQLISLAAAALVVATAGSNVVRGEIVTAYNETFGSDAGIWSGGGFTRTDTEGNPAGAMVLHHVHQTVGEGVSWQYDICPASDNSIAVSGKDLRISFDSYQSAGWTIYPYLQFYVGFADGTEQWDYLPATNSVGVWSTAVYSKSFAKELAHVQFTQIVEQVYNTKNVFIDNLTLAFDNVKVGYTATPEPGAAVLLTTGCLALLAYAWRKGR